MRLFWSTFGLIFLAELPDKTALATLVLASRNRALGVFVGVAGAFVVQCAIAVAFGGLVSLLPRVWVHDAAGTLFFVFAAWMWFRTDGPEEAPPPGTQPFWKTVSLSFVTIFVAEWGDLTQLATATLAARYRAPATIFAASVAALWSVTALAVLAGRGLKQVIRPDLLSKTAAIAFAAAGAFLLLSK